MDHLWIVSPTAISATLYAGVQGVFAARMARHAPSRAARSARVSILKPVAGLDDELRDNLETFAALEHDRFELLLGVASLDDPAVPVLRSFLAAHPRLDARLVVTDPAAATNPKVAQLLGLAVRARGDVLVISDANVRVRPDYLGGLLGRLLRPGVGLVTSVVSGTGEQSLGAMIENAQLGAFIAPSVVAAVTLGRTISVGKSMAMRRADLERIGGLAAVADVLAEDDVLGQRFRDAGFEVDLCLDPVENRNIRCSLRRTLERHTRWAKMRRAIAPRAFVLEPLLLPFVVAVTIACVAPCSASFRAVVATWALQCLGTTLALRMLRRRWPRWQLVAVEPLRALVAFACWLGAWGSRRVAWRGHAFTVGAMSALTPVDPAVPVSTRLWRLVGRAE